MRKLFSVLIVLALLASAIPAWAAFPSDSKYVITNTSPRSQVTKISTDIITPGQCRILRVTVGVAFTPGFICTSTESVAGLYDTQTTGGALNNCLEGEIESNDSDSVSYTYARPLNLANGVTIIQGAYTVVTIEYEKVIP